MTLLILLLAVLLLIVLITVIKLHPFISFLIVCILAGLCKGMEVGQIVGSIQKGIGELMGSLMVILCIGAMLGKLVAESGGANTISSGLIRAFGTKHIQWALVVTAFLVGLPLFYGVGFVLLIPLIFTLANRYKLPAVYLGLPAIAALSVTHGFLPPHPIRPMIRLPSACTVPWPDTKQCLPSISKGLYTPIGFGAGGRLRPSFAKFSSGVMIIF